MNSYNEIITCIRDISNGKKVKLDISQILLDHDCFYLLHKCGADRVDHDIQKQISWLADYTTEYYKLCKSIFFDLRDIPYASIKGAGLSQRAYGSLFFRYFGDIDLLIERKHLTKVKKIMKNNGFIQGKIVDNGIKIFSREELIYYSALCHQTAPFVKKTDSELCPYINIDLNFEIYWGERKVKSDIFALLQDTELMNIMGSEVKVLSEEIDFIVLCLHHFKHMNSLHLLAEGSFNLSLFSDIYFYLKNNNIDRSLLKKYADSIDAGMYIYYCLYYTMKIFKDDFLKNYLTVFYCEQSNRILKRYGLTREEGGIWNISFYERLLAYDFVENFRVSLTSEQKKIVSYNEQNL